MERILNITIDDVSNMEYWEKEALFKTLLDDVNMEFKVANLVVDLYVDSKIYKGKIPEELIQRSITKLNNRN